LTFQLPVHHNFSNGHTWEEKGLKNLLKNNASSIRANKKRKDEDLTVKVFIKDISMENR
jgi:hypothetical protein